MANADIIIFGSSYISSDDILLHDVSMLTSLPMQCSHIHRLLFYALKGQQCTAEPKAAGCRAAASVDKRSGSGVNKGCGCMSLYPSER